MRQKSTVVLRPCPFCGGYRDDLVISDDNGAWCVVCLECNTEGPVSDSKDDAIQLWNTRDESQQTATADSDKAKLQHAEQTIAKMRDLLFEVHIALETQSAHHCVGVDCAICPAQTPSLRDRVFAMSEAA